MGDPADLVAWLRATVPGLLADTSTPGLSLALAHRGSAWTGGFGDMRAASVVPGGSMTKPYTAVAVLQLVEQGIVGLDEPVRRHLPELSLENPLRAREVTVRDLLSFRSGLAVDTTSAVLGSRPPPLGDHLRDALADPVLREYHARLPRWAAPAGERYQYSNLGIAILGRLVERLAGNSRCFADCVAATVLEPLGLRSTAFAPEGTRLASRPPSRPGSARAMRGSGGGCCRRRTSDRPTTPRTACTRRPPIIYGSCSPCATAEARCSAARRLRSCASRTLRSVTPGSPPTGAGTPASG